MQADVAYLGYDPSVLDEVHVSGVVLTGVNAGANLGGSIWEDPVAKGGKYRAITDLNTSNTSKNISSATAKFAPTDVGGTVVAAGIPAGDVIDQVVDAQDAVLHTAATADHAGEAAQLNGDAYNTNYTLDLNDALGCSDGIQNNANISQVLSGGGGSSSTSALGSTGIPGLSFQSGQ
jgi:hypothetical protein